MAKSDVVAFLLSSEPWSSYRARLDLLGEAADSAGATADRARMMASPPVARLIADVGDWPGPVLERHDKATLLIHELAHLKIKNHSTRFWNEVGRLMPAYKRSKDWLKKNGHLLTLSGEQ